MKYFQLQELQSAYEAFHSVKLPSKEELRMSIRLIEKKIMLTLIKRIRSLIMERNKSKMHFFLYSPSSSCVYTLFRKNSIRLHIIIIIIQQFSRLIEFYWSESDLIFRDFLDTRGTVGDWELRKINIKDLNTWYKLIRSDCVFFCGDIDKMWVDIDKKIVMFFGWIEIEVFLVILGN